MSSAAFDKALQFGKVAESQIARWLRSRGNTVMPVYEIEVGTGKGPQLFTPSSEIIAPDMFIFRGRQAQWIEAKHKTAFTWHRITGRWVTGIDRRHYLDYLRVSEESPWPVWLLFLHLGGHAKDSPSISPSGLFGNNLAVLRNCVNHEHENWGRTGMVYWSITSLVKLAEIEEIVPENLQCSAKVIP